MSHRPPGTGVAGAASVATTEEEPGAVGPAVVLPAGIAGAGEPIGVRADRSPAREWAAQDSNL